MKKDMKYFYTKKEMNEKVAMLTCYDYPTAMVLEEAGMDSVLVGDSVGTNMLGYENERQVTMEDMLHHVQAVKRGIRDAYLVGDMPYASYDTIEAALANAQRFIAGGADAVKLEGFHEDIIGALSGQGIDVIAHIGLNPQESGERRAFGKRFAEAVTLIEGAKRLEAAGAKMVLLEKIPEKIAEIITRELKTPTIGIGSGRFCDQQVLVINDIIGYAPMKFKHIKTYGNVRSQLLEAVCAYRQDVISGGFPGAEHANIIMNEEWMKVVNWMENNP